MPSVLVNVIHAQMARLGIEQVELARRAGVPKQTLSNILNEHTTPELPTLGKLAKGLDLNLATLIEAAGYTLHGNGASDEVTRLARLLERVPWLMTGVEKLAELPPEKFRELLDYMEFRARQTD